MLKPYAIYLVYRTSDLILREDFPWQVDEADLNLVGLNRGLRVQLVKNRYIVKYGSIYLRRLTVHQVLSTGVSKNHSAG